VIMDSQAADVSAIESVFNADWSGAAPSPGPAGTDLVWSPGSEPQLTALVNTANHNVTVENEEMDSTPIEAALEAAAQRGVDVTVIMTSNSAWDSAFSRLESAGVHVVLYPDTSSARYIHAKAIDIDGTKAFIGSENFSTSSLDYNRELGLITTSADVVGPLSFTLLSDAAGGQQQAQTTQPHTATTSTSMPAVPVPPTGGGPGCYPITNEGGCYKPGEYCRNDDHGVTGRAGNGEAIVCEDKNGWYWEPA
jgi:phosphatidylserine/phosphatidylglycerophosphate/cardiolipin synthase-like enzyme